MKALRHGIPVMVWAAIVGFGSVRSAAQSGEQAQIDFANGLFARGFNAEAVQEYRTYLSEYPDGEDRGAALYRLGEAESALGNYEAALKAFEDAQTVNGSSELAKRAQLRKGVTLARLGRYDKAEAELRSIIGDDAAASWRPEASYHLGKTLFEAGKLDASIKAFRTLLDVGSGTPYASYGRYQLALVHLRRDNFQESAVLFSEVAGDENAEGSLRMEARFRAAEIYDKLGWFDAAVKAYRQLQDEFPDSEYSRKAAYGYAWALYHAGKYREAIVAADQFITAHADSPHVPGMLYLRGNSLQQQDEFDQAIDVYTRLRKEHADSPFAQRAQVKQAWTHYFAGDRKSAFDLVRGALSANGNPPLLDEVHFLMGTIMQETGDCEQALVSLTRVANDFPDSEFAPESLYKTGECLYELGRYGEAADAYERFAAAHPSNPLVDEALLRAGDAAFHARDFEAATARYARVIDGTEDGTLAQEAMYRLAVSYHNVEQYAQSRDAFENLLERFPESSHLPEAHLRIGEYLLREDGTALESIEHFQAAYDSDPQGPHAAEALHGLALGRFETKDHEGAAETFLRLIQMEPEVSLSEDTYAWVGQHFLDEQQWGNAIVALEAFLRQYPNHANAGRVRFRIAEASEEAGNVSKALDRYAQVVELVPRTALALDAKYRMARLYEDLGELERATGLYEEAANANNGDTAARARFRLGELYEQQEEFETAARHYMRVAILFLHPELSPEALWRAGRCFEHTEDRDQAEKTYQELVDEYPQSEQATKARERLQALGA